MDRELLSIDPSKLILPPGTKTEGMTLEEMKTLADAYELQKKEKASSSSSSSDSSSGSSSKKIRRRGRRPAISRMGFLPPCSHIVSLRGGGRREREAAVGQQGQQREKKKIVNVEENRS